ncbi:MAG TPA: RNB domain-containing ribonuclease [Solirubrobacteraceae bacterium]|nr:RNB domain-containing ribonuclease [Solirubrobacteraceae bacterium]
MSRPGPAEPLVAVLRRRGRFLVAEPLFEPTSAGIRTRGPAGRAGAGGIVVGPASNSRSGRGGAGDGDLALVQPARRGSSARVVRRIGRPDVARDVIEGMLIDRGLRREFSPDAEREAEEAGARVMANVGGRRDLRDLATFTIDPLSARDFDDAISAEALGGERRRVWVHIADVSAHLPEGSRLDLEARERATSVYAPGTVAPMLPHALSSEACSLRPGEERAAVTAEMELDGAQVVRSAFYRSLIRSDARLDYDFVDEVFAGRERAAEPYSAPLQVARRAAAALERRRESAGALVLDSPEPEFEFDERGDVVEVRGQVQTESHRLIEHLMIAANEAVARLLSERRVPCLYRVHERPDPQRVERLVDQLASLEVPTPPLPETMSSTQAAELVGQISANVQRHLARNGGRGRLALGSLILRTLKQAYYSPVNLGHAGLHSSAYCHFTSPIRRYPDVVCHRALLSSLGAGEPQPRASELAELGAWTSEREREAMQLERDADDVAACFALERLLGREGPGRVFEGEITGLIASGAFIAFSPDGFDRDKDASAPLAPPFEGMLPVRLLRARRPQSDGARAERSGSTRGRGSRRTGPAGRGRGAGREAGEPSGERDWWELNEEGTILTGERTGAALKLGDRLGVRAARVDAVRGRVDLEQAG